MALTFLGLGSFGPLYNTVQIRELKLSPRHLQALLLQITTLVMDWSDSKGLE